MFLVFTAYCLPCILNTYHELLVNEIWARCFFIWWFGIITIVKEAYQDPTTDEVAWVCVNVAPKEKLKNPVTLAAIKANPNLADMQLIKQSRLSVSAVTKEEFDEILKMSKKG